MPYTYKMVQLPATVAGKTGGQGEAAATLEQTVNQHAPHGWEFYRVDSFSTVRPQGCFGGGPGAAESYNVVTFRKETPAS